MCGSPSLLSRLVCLSSSQAFFMKRIWGEKICLDDQVEFVHDVWYWITVERIKGCCCTVTKPGSQTCVSSIDIFAFTYCTNWMTRDQISIFESIQTQYTVPDTDYVIAVSDFFSFFLVLGGCAYFTNRICAEHNVGSCFISGCNINPIIIKQKCTVTVN